MSYKTNPITNRLNINKGWINANFPENLSFYARDNVFFFKLYLFLKSYFTLRNIKLISCQIRYGQDYVPVLYLIINTTTRRKKRKSTRRLSTFMHLRPKKIRAGFKSSPLRNPWKIEALTLMFSDQAKLKKIFNAYLLPLFLQKPSQLWLTKPRKKTWLNFLTKIRKGRAQFLRKNFQPIRTNFKSKMQSSLELKLSRTMKEFLLLSKIIKVVTTLKSSPRTLNPQTLTFYQHRLKHLSQSMKTLNSILMACTLQQPKFSVMNHSDIVRADNVRQVQPRGKLKDSHLKSSHIQKKRKLRHYQKERAQKLIIQFQQEQFKFFQQIFKKSQFYETNLNWIQQKMVQKNPMWQKFWRSSKRKLRKSKFWKKFTQLKSSDIQKFPLIRNQRNLKKLLLNLFTIRFKLEKFPKRHSLSKLSIIFNLLPFPHNPDRINSLGPKTLSSLLSQSSRRKEAFRNKLITRFLQKKSSLNSQKSIQPVLFRQFQQLRFKKKMRLNRIDRTNGWSYLRKQDQSNSNLIHRSRFQTKKKSFNQTKSAKLKNKKPRTSPKQLNVFQLTRAGFSSSDKVSDAKVRSEKLENKKLRTRTYRQSFRNSYKKHLNLLVRYQYKLWIQKVLQIFLKTRFEVKFTQPLTQFKNFKFLRLVYPIPAFRQPKKIELAHAKHNLYSAEDKFLGKRYVYLGTGLKRFNLSKKPKFNLNTYSFHKKVDLFKRLRRKKLTDYTQRRLGSIKNKLLMREFVPVLSLFIKYLNPQILADHLAKEFEKTKKHRQILFALKTALRSLKFARGIGYRIAIVGRINSSTKSRAFYFTKKNLRRQNFEQKINYATAQAKARIGAFGIKVWLFY